MLDDINLFIYVADAGSLKRAAEQLQIPLPTVSRRMTKLEAMLGCLLFHRSTNGLVLTKEGEIYYESCAWHARELTNKLSNLDQSLNSLEGELHILAPTNFATVPMEPFWGMFARKYPEIRLRIELDNQLTDFRASQADLALRIGELPDSSLIQTKLGTIDLVLVCAGNLDQERLPESVEDLQRVPTVSSSILKKWNLIHQDQTQYVLHKEHDYLMSDLQLASSLIQSGMGVGLQPISQVYALLKAGVLKRVLPKWSGGSRLVSIVRPSRNYYSVRAKAFHDELSTFIKAQEWLR